MAGRCQLGKDAMDILGMVDENARAKHRAGGHG